MRRSFSLIDDISLPEEVEAAAIDDGLLLLTNKFGGVGS
jgi:hypothetical protein